MKFVLGTSPCVEYVRQLVPLVFSSLLEKIKDAYFLNILVQTPSKVFCWILIYVFYEEKRKFK